MFSEPGRRQPEVRGQRAKLTPSIPLDSYKRALNSGQNNPWIIEDGEEVGRDRERETEHLTHLAMKDYYVYI